MNEELTPTPAAEWPKNVAQTVTLPSGAVAKVKRPDTFALIREGKVPKKVAAIMARQRTAIMVLNHTDKPLTEAEALTLIEFLIAASFVDPEVTFTRKAGVLCIRDVGDEDKAAVMNLLRLV